MTDSCEILSNNSRFNDLVNTVDGIVWEADAETFDFTYVSRYAEELLGYKPDEWYTSGFWQKIIHPDDRTWAPQYCMDCLNQQITNYEFEYRILNKNNETVWLHDLVTLCFENDKPRWLRGIMVDITQRKKIEGDIKASQARFSAIFESAPVGILLVDARTDEIIEMNSAYCDLVGRDPETVLREGWESYTHPEDLVHEVEKVKKLSRKEIESYDNIKRYIKPDGVTVTAQQHVANIKFDESVDQSQYLIILQDITFKQSYEQEIWWQTNHDALTGLPNRHQFQNVLEKMLKNATRNERQCAVLMIDLDKFKDVNDSYGHDVGDKLIIKAASRLNRCIRESDLLARLGGDEFVVGLTNFDSTQNIDDIAEKIIRKISEEFTVSDRQVFISASIGITIFPDDAENALDLIRNADQAMYQSKRRGRNCYNYFSSDLQKAASQRLALVKDLRTAIAEEQFQLYYQPIIDFSTGEIGKAEALIRWQSEARGFVSPDEFIPLAEETRQIIDIGDWVIQEATRQLNEWQEDLPDNFQLSINTSPIQYESDILSKLELKTKEYQVDKARLAIEITETVFMDTDVNIKGVLDDLRTNGFQLSLDDFGTGYSSLSYLKNFDIDYLKIDRSFVMNLHEHSTDLVLCGAIITMAHGLGIKVIAEGIETAEQMRLLKRQGCDYGQGYYFSRPVPKEEFHDFIINKRCFPAGLSG